MATTDLPSLLLTLSAAVTGSLQSEIRNAVREAVAGELAGTIRASARPTYLARAEAAEYLGLSLRGLDHRRRSRAIAWTKRGGRVMIAIDDLDAYLAAGRVPAKGE